MEPLQRFIKPGLLMERTDRKVIILDVAHHQTLLGVFWVVLTVAAACLTLGLALPNGPYVGLLLSSLALFLVAPLVVLLMGKRKVILDRRKNKVRQTTVLRLCGEQSQRVENLEQVVRAVKKSKRNASGKWISKVVLELQSDEEAGRLTEGEEDEDTQVRASLTNDLDVTLFFDSYNEEFKEEIVGVINAFLAEVRRSSRRTHVAHASNEESKDKDKEKEDDDDESEEDEERLIALEKEKEIVSLN